MWWKRRGAPSGRMLAGLERQQHCATTKAQASTSMEELIAQVSRGHESLKTQEKLLDRYDQAIEEEEEEKALMTSEISNKKEAYSVSATRADKMRTAARDSAADLEQKTRDFNKAKEAYERSNGRHEALMAQ